MFEISVGCSSSHSLQLFMPSPSPGAFNTTAHQTRSHCREGAEVSPAATTGDSVPSLLFWNFFFPSKDSLSKPRNPGQQLPLLCPLIKIKYYKNTACPGAVWNPGSVTFHDTVTKGGLVFLSSWCQRSADLQSVWLTSFLQQNFTMDDSREECKKWGSRPSQRSSPSSLWLGTWNLLLYPVHSVSQSLITLCSVLLSDCFWSPFICTFSCC